MNQSNVTTERSSRGKASFTRLPPKWLIKVWIAFFTAVAAFLVVRAAQPTREEFIQQRFREMQKHPSMSEGWIYEQERDITFWDETNGYSGEICHAVFIVRPWPNNYFKLNLADGNNLTFFARSMHSDDRHLADILGRRYGDILLAQSSTGQRFIATNYHVCGGGVEFNLPTTNGFANLDEFLWLSIALDPGLDCRWLPYE